MSKITRYTTDGDGSTTGIPPQLISLWEKSNDPWGAKDRQSRFIYFNQALIDLLNLDLLKLPPKSDMKGWLNEQLSSPESSNDKEAVKFLRQLQQTDREVERTLERITSLETYCFGCFDQEDPKKEKILQPYTFDKFPLFNNQKECIGTMFHGQKLQFYTIEQYANKESPHPLLLNKPVGVFTDLEFDAVFFMSQSESQERIAKKLDLTDEQEVENYQQAVYKVYKEAKIKIDVSKVDTDDALEALKALDKALEAFKAFCKREGFDRYIPQELLHPHSKTVPQSMLVGSNSVE